LEGRKKVGLLSLGCPKNLVDGEVMLGQLARGGYDIVADPKQADVLVVNTCAFIDRAKQESVDAILGMAREKQTGRAGRLVVTGCLAERYAAEIKAEIPEIDATLGTSEVASIIDAVEGRPTEPRSPGSWIYDHTSPRVLSTPPYLAYVKISEGCDYTCSFCIIPTLRGAHRSREVEDIVQEVRTLVAGGVREVVLVAQDSTRYGLDRGVRDGLAYLLRRLARIRDLHWVRVMYTYPATLSDAVLEVMAGEETIAKYVDIPLQHGSPAVLRRMKRPAQEEHVRGLLGRIREKVPGVAVRSSFIVGFPGETDEEFEELVDLVREARFENVGVFTYSDEEGTPAFDLPGRVSPLAKENRRRRIMALQKRISAEKNRSLVGRTLEVLVEGPHPDTDLLLRGRLESQAPEIDGSVLIQDGTAAPGTFVRCLVTEAHPYDLVARIA
jgi:ribosomal protein S12 methylthiotransferase